MRCVKNRNGVFWYLLIIFCLLLLSFNTTAAHSLKVSYKAGLLSLEAKGVKAEEIFKEISEKCGVEIRNYGNVFSPNPINIRFTELKLKEGIKRIIKVAGIKNHSMIYREVKPGQYQVYAIDFLGEGKPSLDRFSRAATQKHTKKQISRDAKGKEDSSQGNFEERMEEFKDKYQWESSDTQELAGHLLKTIPEKARETGLDGIIKGLDKRIKEGGEETVDEEMFLKAIEETVPPHIAPGVISYVKRYANEFKGDEINEMAEKSPTELFQDSFNEKQFNKKRRTHR